MPRAAMSVATSTRILPDLNSASALSRGSATCCHGWRRRRACRVEALGHLVGTVLGAGEDEGAGHLRIGEKIGQHFRLVGLRHVDQALFDTLDGRGNGGHFDARRVFQQAVGEA